MDNTARIPTYREIAAEMYRSLCRDDCVQPSEGYIPERLLDRLCMIDKLARAAGSELRSRQVIAAVVEQWLRETVCHVKRNED